MKILLNMLSIEVAGFWSFLERYQLRPAMGLLMLTAVLRDAGYEVEMADQRVERFDLEQWIERIVKNQYDIVGLSTYSTTRPHHAHYISSLRKKYKGLIIVGGPAVMKDSVDFWLDSGADIAVLGEGERTLLEIIERMESGKSIEGVAGTVVRNSKNETVWGPSRDFLTIQELEALPYPAWNSYWIREYTDHTIINAQLPTAGMITTRGCPYRCAFCGSPNFWKGVRQRSVENVMGEIDWLVKNFRIRHIGFLDDIFGLKTKWVLDFCDQLKSRPYQLNWMICTHPLSFGTRRPEVYRAMAEAGLNFISFGAQSANPRVLENINRNPKEIEALRENIPLCRELGIATTLTYIFGLPGDTPETADKAIRFVLDVKPTVADFHPLWYFQGSELGDKYPNCDATPYSFEDHKSWSRKARQKFYLNPSIIFQFAKYILQHNPRYIGTLLRLMWDAFPEYVFEQKKGIKWESGDQRT